MIIPTCTDEGLYRCSVTVPGVTNPPTALVNVTLLENPEVFSLTQLGEFRCMAALGNPAGRLQWVMVRRKGNRLRNITMGGMTSQQESSNYCYPVSKSILHVDVTGNDEKIICKVTRGTTTSSRELAISVPFPVRNVKIFSNIGGKEMAYWVKDMAAYSGDAVILNCSAKGRPAPDYTWRLWRENAWVTMNTSGRSALVIDGISKNTSGKYSCTAENRVGGAVHSHSKEIYLSVKGRLEDVTHATPKTKTSPHTIIMIIIFVGVVVVVTTVGVCVLIYCTMIKRRAKRRRKPISSVELEYQPVVRRPSRRFSSDLVPPRARDDFRI
ncbi:cell adhesion molecule 4-like [Liolophura sinensis]|uniref:cell adhesion molecule 4-like n=1 Tax=Liolophura sinensis TaxID=3198878 RepID=UPI003158700B